MQCSDQQENTIQASDKQEELDLGSRVFSAIHVWMQEKTPPVREEYLRDEL